MTYKNIIVEKKDGIGTITMNRPQVLNALNIETIEELARAVKELEDDLTVHVAIITGKDKAFIAGADIKEMQPMNTMQAKAFGTLGQQ
jgi:enoyl-CoA hydratase